MLNHNTYLGEKGFTIIKEDLGVKDQQFLREKLSVKPFIPKSPIQPEAFPVYRESQKKFYIPRYFGLETYGIHDSVHIKDGIDINVEFKGDLRDYQETIVNKYVNHVSDENGGGLLEVPCGRGKTVIALKILSEMKKKTLIIVHKSFLLNQWIERINMFIPSARVGKIQGQIVDIKDKDIVIGMLQSLSMKEYPQDMFGDFGLTIVDECHHIGAEVFIRSLFKVVTKYTLGLSATMNRKDGLTKVFKMFLGEIIYSEKRDGDDKVLVKAIQYDNSNEEYSETQLDYRGNPQYSTMISKICNFNMRSEFILKVLSDTLDENPSQQIIILAHNKSLLTYFHKAIEYKNIASVGYYIGGMKEKDLKISETKRVILATYAMAAEALDIKSLTTLIMATPKTDVTQSIGRILRSKDHNPVVFDIVDKHDIFQNQWRKRKVFYKKENYKIIFTPDYDAGSWLTLHEPGNKIVKQNGKCLIKL